MVTTTISTYAQTLALHGPYESILGLSVGCAMAGVGGGGGMYVAKTRYNRNLNVCVESLLFS